MYFVKYGKQYLHDPRLDGYMLIDLSLDCEENSCGYCDFTIYPDHPLYDKLRERDADNPIEVYDDDILLFTGFIYELGKEFYLDGHVKCKGDLDYLNESIVRPYVTFSDPFGRNKAPNNLEGYFNWLIEQHNSQVDDNKRFIVGKNQAAKFKLSDTLKYKNDNYPTVINEISSNIINKDGIGGYLNVRHENGIRYIDYLYEWSDVNTQLLDFGVNLTSYTQTDDSSCIATYVLPIGAELSKTKYRYAAPERKDHRDELPLTLINGNPSLSVTTDFDVNQYLPNDFKASGDIIYSKSLVKKYGWIGYTYSNNEIMTKDDLAKAAVIVLKSLLHPQRTIEVKAVDMHLVNPDIKPIRIGEYVRIRSVPHGLDSYFLCRNINLDLNNPENSEYTFGTTFDSFTGEQNKTIKALNSTIRKQIEVVDAISESEKQTSTMAEEVKNQLDNLEVGGVNLLSKTRYFEGSEWRNTGYWETWDITDDLEYREYGRLGEGKGIYQKIPVKKGHIYTFSFYACGDENSSINVCTGMDIPNFSIPTLETLSISNIETMPTSDIESMTYECITTPEYVTIGSVSNTYTRYHATFRALKDGFVYPRVENTTKSWIQIYALKFELGNMPTDWTPAPSDLESVITEQDDAICALYEASLMYQAETDDAICELYELVTGG